MGPQMTKRARGRKVSETPQFPLKSQSATTKWLSMVFFKKTRDHVLKKVENNLPKAGYSIKCLVRQLFTCFWFQTSFLRSTWQWNVVQYGGWRTDEGFNPNTVTVWQRDLR